MENDKVVLRPSPLNHIVFGCIFKDLKAKPAMLELLNAILAEVGEETIKDIIDLKSEYSLLGESADQKYGRLDVRVKGSSGRLFDVEVQIDKDFMNERGFFYGGRMVYDEFESGTPYDQIPHVCVININNFHVREGSREIVEPVGLLYKKAPVESATEAFVMYHIQLPEFRKKYKGFDAVQGTPFQRWMYLLDTGYKSEEEMKMLAQMSVGMKNFAEQYGIAMNDPTLIRRYRLDVDARRDEATRINVAEKRGEEKGKKIGEKIGEKKGEEKGKKIGEMQGALRIAKNLKAQNIDPSIISVATGLTLKQIAEL